VFQNTIITLHIHLILRAPCYWSKDRQTYDFEIETSSANEALTIQPRPLRGTIFERYVNKYILTTQNNNSHMKCWILTKIILIHIGFNNYGKNVIIRIECNFYSYIGL